MMVSSTMLVSSNSRAALPTSEDISISSTTGVATRQPTTAISAISSSSVPTGRSSKRTEPRITCVSPTVTGAGGATDASTDRPSDTVSRQTSGSTGGGDSAGPMKSWNEDAAKPTISYSRKAPPSVTSSSRGRITTDSKRAPPPGIQSGSATTATVVVTGAGAIVVTGVGSAAAGCPSHSPRPAHAAPAASATPALRRRGITPGYGRSHGRQRAGRTFAPS